MGKDRKGRESEVIREGDGDTSEGEREKGNENLQVWEMLGAASRNLCMFF